MEKHFNSTKQAEIYAEIYGLRVTEIYDLEDDLGVIAVMVAEVAA